MAAKVTLHETKPAHYTPSQVIPVLGSVISRFDLTAGNPSNAAPQDCIARVLITATDADVAWGTSPDPATLGVPVLAGDYIEFYLAKDESIEFADA